MSSEQMLENVMDELVGLEERIDDLEAVTQTVAELEERVQRLEQRTDMLRLIEQADEMDHEQRRAALWQHCVRRARQRGGEVVLDRDAAETALHHPDIHRTTVYDDMAAVADAVTGDVAKYVARDASETGQAELRVDLRGVDESVDASTLYGGER